MVEKIKLWFDPAGDFLDVRFNDAPGFMKATTNDAVMQRVDARGKVIGFSILGVTHQKRDKPWAAELDSK